MKLSDYLLFAAVLTPTVVVALAAIVSIASPEPAPRYHPPVQVASSAVRVPAGMSTDE